MRTPHAKTLRFAAGLIAVAVLLCLPALCAPAHAADYFGTLFAFGGLGLGMAVTANQLVTRAESCRKSYPVAASTHLYQGTLAFINSSGYLDDDTASGVNKFAGVMIAEVDNSSGSNADLNGEVWAEGEFLLTGSGFSQATVGQRIYATDNYTVTATGTGSAVYVGTCTEYVSSTKIYVRLDDDANDALAVDSLALQTMTFNGATGVNQILVPDNLADAFSVLEATNGYITICTTNGSESISLKKNVVLTDGKTITNSANTTGTSLWGASDKGAFFGGTPGTRPAAYTQTYSTADRTHANPTATSVTNAQGTADGTFDDIGDTTMANQATVIKNNFQECSTQINALIVDVADVKQIVNSIIDDLQALNLAG